MLLRVLALLLLPALARPLPATLIATYNVENYTLADRMADGIHRTAYPKPEREKAALRQVIMGLNADVLALQEMGPRPFLDELQRELRRDGLDYPYAAWVEAGDPDRHVAVLSRLPLRSVRRHDRVPIVLFHRPDRVKRGVLEVTVATPAGDVTLFIIHLKSRRTERPDDPEGGEQRCHEARAVRDLVLAAFPDPARGRFLICGDWNDTRGSRAVRALEKRGRLELGNILTALDSHGDSWTHFYHHEDSYSRIDYVLVSACRTPAIRRGRRQLEPVSALAGF